MRDFSRAHVFVILLGLLLIAFVVRLLIRQRMSERYTFFWLAGIVIVAVLSIFPWLLNQFSYLVGIDYPPSLLFLVATLCLALVSIYQSAEITRLQQKVQDVVQSVAVGKFLQDHPEWTRERGDGS